MSQKNGDWSSWSSSLMAPRIVCIALVVSCVVYAGLMVGGLLPPGEAGPLTYVLPGVGLLMFPAAFIVPRLLPMPEISSPKEEVDGVFGEETVLADPPDARKKFMGVATTHFILRCALNESVSVFALVAYIIAGTPLPICVGLCGASALAILMMFPRTSDWKMRAETKLGARFPESDR